MRLRNWHIEGFGVFCDAGLPDPGLGDGINLLVGPNEAGKSTLLDFLRYTLFGYLSGNALARRAPLRGGNHAGTLSYDKDSLSFHLYRQPGKRNAFDLRDPAGNVFSEEELKGHLGHVTRDVFGKIFGFSLAELGDVELLKSVGAGDLIFAASVGSSAMRIRSVQDSLQKQTDAIFRESRAQGRNVPRLLKLHTELVVIEEQLAIAGEAARAVAGKLVAREQKKAGLEHYDDCVAQTETDIQRLDKLIRGWPLWVERCQAEREKNGLGEVSRFPTSAEATWAALKAEFDKARERAEERSFDVARIRMRLSNLPVKFTLLELANNADMLATKRGEYDVSQQLASNAKRQVSQLRQEWNGLSEELGAEWREEIVRGFDVSLLAEDEAHRLIKRVYDSKFETSAKRAIASNLARDARTLAMECAAKSKKLRSVFGVGGVVSPDEISQHRTMLAEFREALRMRDALQNEVGRAEDYLAQVNLYASQREPSGQQIPSWVTGVLLLGAFVFLAVAVGLVFFNERLGSGISVAFAVLLLALATLLRFAGKRTQPFDKTSGTLSEAENRFKVAKKSLQDHDDYWSLRAAATDFTWPLSESDFAAWDGRIGTQERVSSDAAALSRALDELRNRKTGKYHDFHRAKHEFDVAKLEHQKALDEWSGFLRARGLPETIQTETAISILAKVKEARRQLKDLDQYESTAKELDEQAAAYIKELVIILEEADRPKPSDQAGILVQFEDLRQRVMEQQRQSREKQGLVDELDVAKNTLREAVRIARDARHRCQDFLHGLSVSNEEQFSSLSQRARRGAELSHVIREKDTALLAIFGPAGVTDELKQVTDSETLTSWESEKTTRENEKRDFSRERDKTLQEMEALRLDIEKQLNSDEVAGLQLEAEELREDIRKGISDWLELATAQELLMRTRSKFERENQSPALEEASQIFKLITDGRYNRIFIPLDSTDADLAILRSDGRTLSIDSLSHGTLEQLYLSIRLGYIKQYQSQQDARLPLLMDDVAVNFDPDRMAKTFEALSDCARRGQQIVFFTCHEQLIKLLRPNDRCFRIRDYQFERQPIGPLLMS